MFFELYQIDSAYKSDYWLSEAMNTEPASGLLDDIHTYYDHFEESYIDKNGNEQTFRVTRDTGILVEFYEDTSGDYGTGIIQDYQFNVTIDDAIECKKTKKAIERAYILSEDGQSSFYARVEHIRPICEVEHASYDTQSLPTLPQSLIPASTQEAGTTHCDDLSELQIAAVRSVEGWVA